MKSQITYRISDIQEDMEFFSERLYDYSAITKKIEEAVTDLVIAMSHGNPHNLISIDARLIAHMRKAKRELD